MSRYLSDKKNAKAGTSTTLPRAHSADNSSGKVASLAAALPALSQGKHTWPGTQQKTTISLPYEGERIDAESHLTGQSIFYPWRQCKTVQRLMYKRAFYIAQSLAMQTLLELWR
jgi:hypothetical protein